MAGVTNAPQRPIFDRVATPGSVKVLHHSAAAEGYKKCLTCLGILNPCSCLLCKAEEIKQSTYITAYENKLEYNYPTNILCCLVDQPGVIYYDRDIIKQVGRAGFCAPACTHMSPCPTCFDMCGEGIVLHGATMCSKNVTVLPGAAGFCFCRKWFLFGNIEGADQLANAINRGVQTANNLAMPMPQQQVMTTAGTPAPTA
mmetsp:Transcript_83891/g.116585  ORF Transcript_83891/g.116585 Transcript_83891/m.116585 type:complete len:200 (-) Transcript_83891:168-767(-)